MLIRTTTITLLALAAGCSSVKTPQATALPSESSTQIVTTSPQSSTVAAPKQEAVDAETQASRMALASHLEQIGAKMYGAYWCPYCKKQKELFGEAVSEINYIECDAKGENPQPELCRSAGVRGFPSWEINGQLHPGLHTLEELADLSGYQGSRKF